ncbi:Ankyrin repeat protein 1 [Giardia muris]|uniref:Ankyrin repeat protein 1 n=1 Tax=Giardia muris TaxID=5742 RepID=A0A4Z1SPV5_GIAMU|nr:Ankyrin repeat protein 1 [Giardia muris]|eukprot:TNJ27690.1 Ankyrin repeat protein 1 [Giardia muris]
MSKPRDAAAWFQAAEAGNARAAAAGVKSFKRTRNEAGETALMVAARHGHAGVVDVLAKYEAGVVDPEGLSALLHAVLSDSIACVRTLAPLEKGLKHPDGRDALSVAAAHGNADCVTALVPCFELVSDEAGETALDYAATCDHLNIVQLLVNSYQPIARPVLSKAILTARETGHERIASYLGAILATSSSAINPPASTSPGSGSPRRDVLTLKSLSASGGGCEQCARYLRRISELEAELSGSRRKTALNVDDLLHSGSITEDTEILIKTLQQKLEASDRERIKLQDEVLELRRNFGSTPPSPSRNFQTHAQFHDAMAKLQEENERLREQLEVRNARIANMASIEAQHREQQRTAELGVTNGARMRTAQEQLLEKDEAYMKLKRAYQRLRLDHGDLEARYAEAREALQKTDAGKEVVQKLDVQDRKTEAELQRISSSRLMSHRSKQPGAQPLASQTGDDDAESRASSQSIVRRSGSIYGTMGPPTRTLSRLHPDAKNAPSSPTRTRTSSRAGTGTYAALKDAREKEEELEALKAELFSCYSAEEVEKLHRIIELREGQLEEARRETEMLNKALGVYSTGELSARDVAEENDNLRRRIAARDDAIHKMTRELCTVARSGKQQASEQLEEKDVIIAKLEAKVQALNDQVCTLAYPGKRRSGLQKSTTQATADLEREIATYKTLVRDLYAQIETQHALQGATDAALAAQCAYSAAATAAATAAGGAGLGAAGVEDLLTIAIAKPPAERTPADIALISALTMPQGGTDTLSYPTGSSSVGGLGVGPQVSARGGEITSSFVDRIVSRGPME